MIYIYIYIYISLYTLSGPWKLSGRFVAFPSFTFPLRFRHVSNQRFRYVSVVFPLRFRSRFRCASIGHALARQKLKKNRPTLAPKPNLFWRSGSDLVSQPAISGSIPGVYVFRCVLRYAANIGEPGFQMRRGPKGRTDPNVFQRFRGGI